MSETVAVLALVLVPIVGGATRMLGRRWVWFRTGVGKAATALAISFLMSSADLLFSGETLSYRLFTRAVGIAWLGGGGFSHLKTLVWDPVQKKINALQSETPPLEAPEGPRISLVRAAQSLPPVPAPLVKARRMSTGELRAPEDLET